MLSYAVMSIALYLVLTLVTIKDGGVIGSGPVAWLASPILFCGIAYVFEGSSVRSGGRGSTLSQVLANVFNFNTQAWSFIIGDILLLPFAFVVAADRWSQTSDRSGLSPTWWVICLLVGGLFGVGFHYGMAKPGYTKLGVAASLNSPTKLFHDFVSYPVLSGGLLFVSGPLLLSPQGQWQLNNYTIAIILLIAGWLVLGVLDGRRAKDLAPWGHPRVDKKMRVLPPLKKRYAFSE